MERKRPIIEIVSGDILQDYSKYQTITLAKKLREADMDVRVYLGTDPSKFLPAQSEEDRRMSYHYYTMYGFSCYDRPDVIVIYYRSLRATPVPLDLRRSVAFISEPLESKDAQMRKCAYQDALQEEGIPFREELILVGDFSNRMDEKIDRFLDGYTDVDALICANDAMAESAYRSIKRRGLKVGKDIAVTGFDDIATAKYMSPPLSTVEQNLSLIEHRDQLFQIKRQSLFCVTLLRTLLLKSITENMFFQLLGERLRLIGTEKTYIYLLEQPQELVQEKEPKLPEHARLVLVQEGERIQASDRENAPLIGKGGLPEYVKSDTAEYYEDFLLYYQKYEYGMLRVKIDPEDTVFYHDLSFEIGNGIHYLEISVEKDEAQRMLRDQNQLLDHAATHDELTGLFNQTSLKPYYLGISVGRRIFGYEEEGNLHAILKSAEEQLYEAKKRRRANVVRTR